MWNIKSTDQESGETSWSLRAVAPFADDFEFCSQHPHGAWLTVICNPNAGAQPPSSGLHTCKHTIPICKKRIQIFFKNVQSCILKKTALNLQSHSLIISFHTLLHPYTNKQSHICIVTYAFYVTRAILEDYLVLCINIWPPHYNIWNEASISHFCY